MALFDLRSDAGALEDLFMRERAAILGGRFDLLERLIVEKERLVAAIQKNPAMSGHLIRLRGMAEKNRQLLTAMERGVRAAADRVESLRRKPATLKTYDASGNWRPVAGGKHALHRRA